MARPYTTYSFLDLSGALAHPLLGAFTFTGEGTGSINIVMSTEKTAHDVSADGIVMVSKIAGNNGQIQVNCQQTSSVHKWLQNAYNLVLAAPTNMWAAMSATLRNTSDGTSHLANGMSFSKQADKPYQAQGQRITWTLMAAEIYTVNV